MSVRTTVVTAASRLLGVLASVTIRRGHSAGTPATPQRILVLKPCCLGDVLLSTPLVAALRRGFPAAELTYAVGAWSRPMIVDSPQVDQVLTIPDRWTVGSLLAVARWLREQQYDMVLVPERSPVPGVLCWLAGISVRVGLDSQGRGFAYTHPVPVPEMAIHEADLYLELGRALGLAAGERRLWFFPTAADRDEAAALVEELDGTRPLVVLHPGGGSNPGMVLERKRWLPERWARVADELHREYGAHVLIVGSAAEAGLAAQVGDLMKMPSVSMARQWRWGVLAALIERAQLFLGHDTGMSLLANAVGTRHVVIFGPSDPQMYGPYGPNGRAVWRPTPESPCFYQGSAPAGCPCAGKCMRNVEVEDVIKVAGDLLHGR